MQGRRSNSCLMSVVACGPSLLLLLLLLLLFLQIKIFHSSEKNKIHQGKGTQVTLFASVWKRGPFSMKGFPVLLFMCI